MRGLFAARGYRLAAVTLGIWTAAFPISSARLSAGELSPRQPFSKVPVVARPLPPEAGRLESSKPYRLVVKFRDEVRVRALDGRVISRTARGLQAVDAVTAAFDLTFAPLIRLPEEMLAGLELRAAERSGRAQPDLAGFLEARAPGADAATLEAIGNALQRLEEVEFVEIETLGVPPPGDIAPPTPSLVANQIYRGPNPGLDVDFAWSVGALGTGVRFSDCEYGWISSHEDLVDRSLNPEPGQTVHPEVATLGFDRHGTAVVGATSGVVNAYGVSGIAPGAEVHTYTEYSVEEGLRRLTAITHAIADSGAGDVVLLEMQTVGAGGGFGPAELDASVWTVVRTGTDAGVVVVAAAGNGSQDLDSPDYAEYRSRGDSGAILVGAGSSNLAHDQLSFSTFGSRVNVQGWGQSVFTLGYGTFAQYGGDVNQAYTAGFNGTSSASALVAAAAVVLEGAAGKTLSPLELRDLMVSTGVPQGAGGHIGPLVDLEAALRQNLLVFADGFESGTTAAWSLVVADP